MKASILSGVIMEGSNFSVAIIVLVSVYLPLCLILNQMMSISSLRVSYRLTGERVICSIDGADVGISITQFNPRVSAADSSCLVGLAMNRLISR